MSTIRFLFLSVCFLLGTAWSQPLTVHFPSFDPSLLGLALGAVVIAGERRRVRLAVMAQELQISERKIRQLLLLGMPHCRIQGLILVEPAAVHAWLDRYNRRGQAPGVKRTKGVKVAEAQKLAEATRSN